MPTESPAHYSTCSSNVHICLKILHACCDKWFAVLTSRLQGIYECKYTGKCWAKAE